MRRRIKGGAGGEQASVGVTLVYAGGEMAHVEH